MHRKYFYVILLLTLFFFFLILIFFLGHQPTQKATKEIQVERPPFPTYISGLGIVEPQSGNITLTSPFSRRVEKIAVSVNERVKKGDVLFQLDPQDFQADVNIKQKEYEKALATLQQLEALPRAEDLLIAQEALHSAQAALDAAKAQYDRTLHLPSPNAISKEEQERRRSTYKQAEAALGEAKAHFEKVKAGAWPPELKIAQQQVEQAKAALEASQLELEKTHVKSPIDGTVLQLKIHEGETADPLKIALILGNVEELSLRVSIDQYNVAKFHPDAQAVAFRQGDPKTAFPLTFLHLERVMIQKKYLTNELHEKVDTQIFEILYHIEKNDSPLFIGEQMDVYIDAEK